MSDENEQPKSDTYDQIDRVIHAPARFFIMTTLDVIEGGDMVFLKNKPILAGETFLSRYAVWKMQGM